MFVVKRDGRQEPVMFDKITARIKKLCYGFDPAVIDPVIIAQKVIIGVFNGVSTVELDDLAAQTAAYMTTQHPDYARLAARIAVSNLHKMTDKSFAATMRKLNGYVDPKTGKHAALVSDEVLEIIEENAEKIDGWIVYDRDFDYDYFGFKTLERSYLLRMHGNVVERPQHMLMRVSIGIHKRDLESVLETCVARTFCNRALDSIARCAASFARRIGTPRGLSHPHHALLHPPRPLHAPTDMTVGAGTTTCPSGGSRTRHRRCSTPARRSLR